MSAPDAAETADKPGQAARRAALAMLGLVLDKHRPLDEAFNQAIDGLSVRDRAFVRATVTTALRRHGQIDDLIGRCLDKPLPDHGRAAQHLLRLGAAELLFLDHAPHAAVDGAVTLTETRAPRFKNVVNAVLRRLQRDGALMIAAQDAARLNLPGWLWQRWSAVYSEATTRLIAAAQVVEPPLDLTLAQATDAAKWATALDAEILPTGSLRRTPTAVDALPGYDQAAWWVQDAAAALPARLLGAVAGKRVIDLCAAPGGKTAQLLTAGAEVTAVERSADRAERLAANLARLGLEAEIQVADALRWRPAAPADGVLLDAPCSATGTLRRHPDIAWNKGPDDIAKLAGTQAKLLAAAAAMVKPGGRLVYATCSLEPEEGEQQIARFLTDQPAFTRLPVDPTEIGGRADAVTRDGDLRTLPSQGWDGFFAARLVRGA